MAYASDAPKDGFRPSMLIYDTRYRGYTIQFIVLLLFALFVAWLLNNTLENLAAKGRTFNFGFLWSRAGYDIEQTLVPYTNDNSHFRAWMVGLANTLAVAIPGCILATIVGVIVGVLRLSKNWLIARLMTVYVEIFRNIPLLLWILMIFVPMRELTYEPRDFRVTDEMIAAGQEPAASMWFNDSVAISTRGINAPLPLFDRPLGSLNLGGVSVNLTFLAALVIVLGSVWVNRQIRARAQRVQESTGVRPTTWWQSVLVLTLPFIAFLLATGFHLEYPTLTRFNFSGGILLQHSYTALLIALVLYTGAFIAEIVRGGILAISRGQTEASYALGLRPGRTMSLVILPQALRVIIPPLISQFLNLTKNTSLGIAVSYLDLRGTLGGITLNQTGRELECMLLMMLNYLILSLMISSVANIYNRSIQLKER
ncbi:MAG: ABC transporter permease subunit [Rhodobacteraceae bacterium]|jgi:general L-amino acid transport system permease protein|nr:ABC transporter permease subunit [Paracoccaceae bacterium]